MVILSRQQIFYVIVLRPTKRINLSVSNPKNEYLKLNSPALMACEFNQAKQGDHC